MTTHAQPERPFPEALTPPGRASFEWAVLFAALALIFPLSAVVGLGFAERARRRGYRRWPGAMAVAVWCGILGVILRGFLHLGVVP